jgi:hypothetical protein
MEVPDFSMCAAGVRERIGSMSQKRWFLRHGLGSPT